MVDCGLQAQVQVWWLGNLIKVRSTPSQLANPYTCASSLTVHYSDCNLPVCSQFPRVPPQNDVRASDCSLMLGLVNYSTSTCTRLITRASSQSLLTFYPPSIAAFFKPTQLSNSRSKSTAALPTVNHSLTAIWHTFASPLVPHYHRSLLHALLLRPTRFSSTSKYASSCCRHPIRHWPSIFQSTRILSVSHSPAPARALRHKPSSYHPSNWDPISRYTRHHCPS